MKNYNFYNGNIFATILDREREIEHRLFLERVETEEEEEEEEEEEKDILKEVPK